MIAEANSILDLLILPHSTTRFSVVPAGVLDERDLVCSCMYTGKGMCQSSYLFVSLGCAVHEQLKHLLNCICEYRLHCSY
jgi:hypothetical protein